MKIAIGYPPIESGKGVPLLSQNRQFQYFNAPTYIYPMVPAYAASNLKAHGSAVAWLDGIAEKWTYDRWERELDAAALDVLLMETKCPVIKAHWTIATRLRAKFPSLIIVWVGDHVTCLPQETFDHAPVDAIITGGDYDFLIVDLVNHLAHGAPLPPGFWFPEGHPRLAAPHASTVTSPGGMRLLTTGPAQLTHRLDDLPFIDRELTRWRLYAYENGNYKYTPGTYVYSGRDCWWNKCTFCVWDHTLNPPGTYRSFSPERLFAEVKHVVDTLHVKEVFDDAGTMFVGNRLRKFCELMIESGYNRKVVLGCNMRFDGPDAELYMLMKQAGFRFILYGLESGNQVTLDRIKKGLTLHQIEHGARMCKEAGLEPHITVMLGYPWETFEDAQRTIDFAKSLFRKGYVDTLQATIVIPYPGTPLYRECKENGWLVTEDYDDYDMRRPVMKTAISDAQMLSLTQQLYKSFLSPSFILKKILAIRRWDDITFLFMAGTRVLGHLLDFSPKQKK
ncbi:radical SAM protein [bacterium]|nr:radical SAM protein [bacterium]